MLGCRPLTEQEQASLIRHLPTYRDRVLFTLLLYTGFRISEALSLNVQDVQGERVLISRRNMKGRDRSRSILMHPTLRGVLADYVTSQGLRPDMPLFLNRSSKRLSRRAAWAVLDSAVRRTGLEGKVSFHSARKTFADKMHTHFKYDLVKTSKALGHVSVLSTAAYLSFKTEELDEAVLALGG